MNDETFEPPARDWHSLDFRYEYTLEYVRILDERIYGLHKEILGPYDNYICEHCSYLYGDSADVIPYPCPTIDAYEGNIRTKPCKCGKAGVEWVNGKPTAWVCSECSN